MAVSVRSGAFRTYEHMPPCAALSGHYTEHHGWRDKAKYSPNPEHRWRPLAIGYPLVPLLHHLGLMLDFVAGAHYIPLHAARARRRYPALSAHMGTIAELPNLSLAN